MNILTYIKEEIEVIRERDPAIKKTSEVFLYPSFHAILRYRLAHWFFEREHYFVARWISQRAARRTGIEIHPGAIIGKGLFIDHGNGVVIGETSIIGDNVTIYQGVTLGGTGKEHGKRHPNIENNVLLSAYSQIIGNITIGENSKIGANAVVLEDIPAHCTAVGMPAKVVRYEGEKVEETEAEELMHGSHTSKEGPDHDQTV